MEFLLLQFLMSLKMNFLLHEITWELFHFIWDGMQDGTFYVASELKALEGVCSKIELFPPGHYLHSGDSGANKMV